MNLPLNTLEVVSEESHPESVISLIAPKTKSTHICRRASRISPIFLGENKLKATSVPASTNVLYLDVSMKVFCIHCETIVHTKTRYKNSYCNWVVCSGIAASGCFCGCCLVPFCVNIWKDVEHYCDNCEEVLGFYRV